MKCGSVGVDRKYPLKYGCLLLLFAAGEDFFIYTWCKQLVSTVCRVDEV